MNIDLEEVRKMREKIRHAIRFGAGKPITDEQLSACLAMLGEVWTLRIYCSPESQIPAGMTVPDLFKIISDGISDKLREQAATYLPHAKTFTMFQDRGEKPE